jgi:two-component system OmpR family response regulator
LKVASSKSQVGELFFQRLSRLHNDEVYDRSVDVQVGRLRRKIQRGKDELIRTERGAGYVFTAPVEIVR